MAERGAHTFGFEAGRPVLVYGLGASGHTAIDVLSADGVMLWAWDDEGGAGLREDLRARPLVEVRAPQDHEWAQVQAVVKTPGISLSTPLMQAALAAGVPIISEIDLFSRRLQAQKWQGKIIGITGTNGKSTTTALVAHVLRQAGVPTAAGGNLGTPALALPALADDGVYVLELSSYQLETLRDLHVDAGVLLNLTPDHLARHGTMEAYLAAKLRMFDLAKPGAVMVLGVDQDLIADAVRVGMETLSVAGKAAAWQADAQGGLHHDGKRVLELSQFDNLPGPHNWQNIAAAYLLVRPWMGAGKFVAAVNTFTGLPHRLELLRTVNGVAFVNDSKATNGDSTVPALQSFKNIYWICGGEPKTDGLGATLQHLGRVRAAFTIGAAAEDFAAQLTAAGIETQRCDTLDVAVSAAYAAAKTGGKTPAHVLLSPACASFDQFKNFEERGNVFRQLVDDLAVVAEVSQ